MTRSISRLRPVTGSAGLQAYRVSSGSWSRIVEPPERSRRDDEEPALRGLLLRAGRAGEELDDGLADLLQLGADAAGGLAATPSPSGISPEQDVLVPMWCGQLEGLAKRQLEDLLGPGA